MFHSYYLLLGVSSYKSLLIYHSWCASTPITINIIDSPNSEAPTKNTMRENCLKEIAFVAVISTQSLDMCPYKCTSQRREGGWMFS